MYVVTDPDEPYDDQSYMEKITYPRLVNLEKNKDVLKPFDLKSLDKLSRRHPYYETMFIIYKYYIHLTIPDVNNYGDDDAVGGVDEENMFYFKKLDRFYRYGFCFNDYDIFPGNIIGVRLNYCDDPSLNIVIKNSYNLKTLMVNLNDCDRGELKLSEVEKWKRKVIVSQRHKKKKIILLDPKIYQSFITFYIFSNLEDQWIKNKFDHDISYDEICNTTNQKITYYNYGMIKEYEDKIFEKYPKYFNDS